MASSRTLSLGKWARICLWVAVFYLVTGILDQLWFKQKFDVVDGFFVIAPLVLGIVLFMARSLSSHYEDFPPSTAPDDQPR